MLKATTASDSPRDGGTTLVDRVNDAVADLTSSVARGRRVWARSSGPHVLLGALGVGRDEAFARLTPLGGVLFGLAFRALEGGNSAPESGAGGWGSASGTGSAGSASGTGGTGGTGSWEPMLLIDDLPSVVEHALVALEVIVVQ